MTSMPIRTAFVLIAAAIAASCAAMSEQECVGADWRRIGIADGEAGRDLSFSGERAKACSKHGIALDQQLYASGRNVGLMSYCTPANAMSLAEAGQSFPAVCADHNAPGVRAAYDTGRKIYEYAAPARLAGAEIHKAQGEAQQITERLDAYASGERPFEKENHNEIVIGIWAKRTWLATVSIPYWSRAKAQADDDFARFRARLDAADPGAWGRGPLILSGPPGFKGATEQDARDMLAETFAKARSKPGR